MTHRNSSQKYVLVWCMLFLTDDGAVYTFSVRNSPRQWENAEGFAEAYLCVKFWRFNPENETIYLSHFYISDHLTQIHKALFIYHMQFSHKVLVSTMCWCNSIFWKFQSLLFVSIFIHYDVKNCPVCYVGIFYTILFTWRFFKNVLQ